MINRSSIATLAAGLIAGIILLGTAAGAQAYYRDPSPSGPSRFSDPTTKCILLPVIRPDGSMYHIVRCFPLKQ